MNFSSVFLPKFTIFVVIIMTKVQLLVSINEQMPDYTKYNWNSEFSSTSSDSNDTRSENSDESWHSALSEELEDYTSDLDEILQHIMNENQIISDGKTWNEACQKPAETSDLCDGHPYDMLEACVNMAERMTSKHGGFEFNLRYIIIGDGIKCTELNLMGFEEFTRPMYQCPNINIQTEFATIRLPIFYISQSCHGKNLYAFKRTGEYKLAKAMGEWKQFQVKHWPSDTPMPPKGVWLLYTYNTRTNHRSPASVIKALDFSYDDH